MHDKKIQLVVKKIFDIVFALLCSAIAVPVILITMLIIKVKSPEDPVIFRQTRIGYHEKPFTIYKLRTMTNERDTDGNLLPDEQRLKTWGKVIRKLSIDELTQILNILMGQMSWIGPRPLLPKEMGVMTKEEQRERQSMMPGISGWEAVNEDKSDDRQVNVGMLISTIAIFGAAAVCCIALIANIDMTWSVGVPALVLAQMMSPIIATLFSVIIYLGIFTTACPLLWNGISKVASDGTSRYKVLTVIGGMIGCIVACFLPYKGLLNVLYGMNGYLGFVLAAFMIVADIRLELRRKSNHV